MSIIEGLFNLLAALLFGLVMVVLWLCVLAFRLLFWGGAIAIAVLVVMTIWKGVSG